MKKNLILILYSIPFLLAPLFSQTAQQKEILEQVKSHYGLQEITPRHQQGFIYQFALLEMYDQLSPDLQKVADSYIHVDIAEAQEIYLSPSGRFILHYDTIGDDAVASEDISGNGIPDYVDSAAVFLDHAWQIEVNQLGFQPPLASNGEPVDAYHVYFRQLPYGNYGITWFDSEITSLPGENYTSHLELDSDFEGNGLYTFGLDAMRVTCAHEFNHAIQLSYRYWGSTDTYFFEMTSVWLEELLYPQVNDYHQYLHGLFAGIQDEALTSNSYPYLYGNGIYLQMLAKQFNPTIVPEIWQRIKDEPALDALNTVLNRNSSSFKKSLNDYGKWMYFTGNRAIRDDFFDDAADFPQVNVKVNNQLSGDINISHDFPVHALSFTYLSVDSMENQKNLAKISNMQNGSQLMLNFFTPAEYASFAVEENSPLFVWLREIPQDVTFVVSNASSLQENVSFSLAEDTETNSEQVESGPNPVVQGNIFNFRNLPVFTKVYILDISQRVIRKLEYATPGDPYLQWNLRDSKGKEVSSGIYYFIAKSSGKTQTGKIAVVR